MSAPTRSRVVDAAEALGYRPNLAARNLRSTKTFTLGIVVASLANPIFVEYLRGAAGEAAHHNYSVLICDAEYDPDMYRLHLTRLYEHRVDALIIGDEVQPDELLEPFHRAAIPIVDTWGAGWPGDVFAEAFDYVFGLGHARVAYLRLLRREFEAEQRNSYGRVQMLKDAAERAGLSDQAVTEVDGYEVEEVVTKLRALLGASRRPTALIVTAPLVVAALETIREIGLRLPEDISLLVLGDARWAQAFDPPIGSVWSDMHAAGRASVQRALALIDGTDDGEATRPTPLFYPRGSLRPPPPSTRLP